jgi:hypothetical protein
VSPPHSAPSAAAMAAMGISQTGRPAGVSSGDWRAPGRRLRGGRSPVWYGPMGARMTELHLGCNVLS